MLKNAWIYLIVFLLFSCKKDEVEICTPPPMSQQWERFAGNYFVYDSLGSFLYEMSIEHFFSGLNEHGNESDSLSVINLNNQFEFEFEFDNSIDPNFLDLENINPLINYNSHHFYFWHNADDPETDQVENYLTNDTIYLSYILDNTPYWLEDGVPFFSCECREIAVKQN